MPVAVMNWKGCSILRRLESKVDVHVWPVLSRGQGVPGLRQECGHVIVQGKCSFQCLCGKDSEVVGERLAASGALMRPQRTCWERRWDLDGEVKAYIQ